MHDSDFNPLPNDRFQSPPVFLSKKKKKKKKQVARVEKAWHGKILFLGLLTATGFSSGTVRAFCIGGKGKGFGVGHEQMIICHADLGLEDGVAGLS